MCLIFCPILILSEEDTKAQALLLWYHECFNLLIIQKTGALK